LVTLRCILFPYTTLFRSYVQDDLYVFVIGIEDGIVHAHGGQPRQVGRKAADIVDASGKRFLEEMITVAREKGEGEVRYTFRNPRSEEHTSELQSRENLVC